MRLIDRFKSTSKINLYLDIVGKDIIDNYHYIESVFYEIDWGDDFSVYKSDSDIIVFEGEEVVNIPEENTVSNALRLFKEKYSIEEKFKIVVSKNVPMGAGLGGGSGNAGAMLKWLANRFEINPLECLDIAFKIGSDVPFFLYGGMALVEGKGEKITPINNRLEDMALLIIYPGIHISTKKAFQSIDNTMFGKKGELIKKNLLKKSVWGIDKLHNVLYNVFNNRIDSIDKNLCNIMSEIHSSMNQYSMLLSGSGSSFVLFYKTGEKAENDLKLIIKMIEQQSTCSKYFIQYICPHHIDVEGDCYGNHRYPYKESRGRC